MLTDPELNADSRATIAKRRFLVVDDFSTMRRIVSGLLRELGAESILEAEDGIEAFAKLQNTSVDFIVSDWNMPRMTGLELLKALRADQRFAKIPLLLITAEARKENIVDAVREGADGYIVKPFASNVLGDKIKTILKRRNEA
jgi:two-component system chemotaxis response regulator CheY